MSAIELDRDERRAHPRRRVFKRAKVIFNLDRSVMDCMLRDLSQGGARLSCTMAALLPGQFELFFLAEREIRSVRVAWRSATELGVAFVSPPRKALHLLL